jgi:serine/threonine-protein kinase
VIGNAFAGKYNYVSPEQLGLFGGEVTAKSDIYSLGLVLYEALTGTPLDMGGNQFQVVEKRRKVPDLGAIDMRIRPLIDRMLQPAPADRPESMTAVAKWPLGAPQILRKRDLNQVHGEPADAGEATPRAARRRRRLWPLLAGGAGLAAVAGAAALVYVTRPTAPLPPPPAPPPLQSAAAAPTPEPPAAPSSLAPPPSLTPAGGSAPVLQPASPPSAAAPPALNAAPPATGTPPPPSMAGTASAGLTASQATPPPGAMMPPASLEPATAAPTPAAPAPTTEAALVPARPAPPPKPLSRAEQITRYIRSYDGGECFFITPTAVTAGTAKIEAYGALIAPFTELDDAFKRAVGFEAEIGLRQIAPAQCPAVTFVSHLRARAGALKLKMPEGNLKASQPVSGTVEGHGGSRILLLLVQADGSVEDLSARLKPAGAGATFSLRFPKPAGEGPAQPHLLMAVTGAPPLDTLKGGTAKAEQLFPQLRTEAEAAQLPLAAELRYFKLEK